MPESVRLNEISSNGQIKPNQISLDDKGKKKRSKVSASLTHRKKVLTGLLNFALTRRKFNKILQRTTIILEGDCNLQNGSNAQGLQLWSC